jgi:hypothetical protein
LIDADAASAGVLLMSDQIARTGWNVEAPGDGRIAESSLNCSRNSSCDPTTIGSLKTTVTFEAFGSTSLLADQEDQAIARLALIDQAPDGREVIGDTTLPLRRLRISTCVFAGSDRRGSLLTVSRRLPYDDFANEVADRFVGEVESELSSRISVRPGDVKTGYGP